MKIKTEHLVILSAIFAGLGFLIKSKSVKSLPSK